MSNKNKHKLHRKEYRHILLQNHAESRIVALREAPSVSRSDKEVIVYQSELDYLSRCILDCPHIETGGQLFGFYAAKGTPVVCYAIGPGPHANHQTAFFNQDIGYLQDIGDILTREYGLQHIGEWHSHHQLGLDRPSSHDAHTMHSSIDSLNLGRFLLCVGTIDGFAAKVNAFAFYENDPAHYSVKWNIKAQPSPYRHVIDDRLGSLLLHPHTLQPRLANMSISRISVAKDADVDYLLRAYNNI